MKKSIVFTLLILFCALGTNAQTKRIAHRSHSGKHNNYPIFQSDDNLGDAGAMIEPELPVIRPKTIDSVNIKDSLNKARQLDSLKKLKETLDSTRLIKDTTRIQKTKKEENQKKDNFSLPVILLIVLLLVVIVAIITRNKLK